jgi:chromosome partitioning protein
MRAALREEPPPGPTTPAAVPDVDDTTPIGVQAAAAVRALNPGGPLRLPLAGEAADHHRRQPEGRRRQDHQHVNLAAALALHGATVLVIDLDPQGNASTGLGWSHSSGTPNVVRRAHRRHADRRRRPAG